jgi:phosphoadenosine phosphosulfate reductase
MKEMTLQEKIDHSIALIRKAEKLALKMRPEMGFHVGFSGGKDSQAVLELVKMAGVKYRAVYSVTTNDPADNVRFIKQHYPDVEFSVPEKSYFQLIAQKGVPTMFNRWCCALFKETAGVGYVVLTGVRKEESRKRAAYEEVGKWSRSKDEKGRVDLDKMEANEFRCVGGKDKFMVYPILEWTEEDVWEFIALRRLPVNPCYKTHKRVGCVFCPFARPKEVRAYCETHPKLKAAFINAIEQYREKAKGRQRLSSAEDYFDWWVSKESLDTYLSKKRQTKIEFKKYDL